MNLYEKHNIQKMFIMTTDSTKWPLRHQFCLQDVPPA